MTSLILNCESVSKANLYLVNLTNCFPFQLAVWLLYWHINIIFASYSLFPLIWYAICLCFEVLKNWPIFQFCSKL